MATTKLPYKGKEIVIEEEGDKATVTVDGKEFPCTRHPGTLSMWHCDDGYFASPELKEVAKHIVDYLYIFTDPNFAKPAPVEGGHEHGGHEHGGHQHDAPTPPAAAKSTRRRGGGHQH
jgi:hypothetical protein